MERIYLDYAAATPTAKEVIEEMLPYLEKEYGNAGALHSFGQRARSAIDKSREIVSSELNANFSEIIFTGSATEANNLIIRGTVIGSKIKRPHIIISSIEHESVIETCESLGEEIDFTIVQVSKDGTVDVNEIKDAIKKETVLVSIIFGSNVIGTIQPIKEIGEMIKELRGDNKYPLFHSDGAQAFQFEKIDVKGLGLDAFTISAQKIYGPKGVGALFLKESIRQLVSPIITGGSQEFGMRAGTPNTPAIVGFGKAVEILSEERDESSKKTKKLRDYLWENIQKEIPGVEVNGSLENRLPNNLNLYFPNTDGETLLIGLDQAGIGVSIGSACKAQSSIKPHAIKALGLGENRAGRSIRITLGKQTTKEELDIVVKKLQDIL